MGAHPAMAEMTTLAAEARSIVERVDIRQSYALDTPAAWNELLEAMIRLKFDANLPAASHLRLRQITERWKYLYGRLRLSAGTRPGWIT
jgi:hypothetical protein